MRIPALLVAFASFFLLFGCLNVMNNYNKAYANDNFYTGFGNEVLDTSLGCTTGACACFVCDSSDKSVLGGMVSLKGKTCYVDPSCTSQDYFTSNQDMLKLLIDDDLSNNKPEHSIRNFMLGAPMQGFSKANNNCFNSLSMATQWLIAPVGGEYPSVDTSRAGCYLGINTLPVYLLFSKDMANDFLLSNKVADRSETLAASLKSAGPAIISTEANITYNDFKNDQVQAKIKEQLAALRTQCPRVQTISSLDSSDPPQTIYDAQPTSDNTCLVGAFIPYQKATPENIKRVADFIQSIPVGDRPDMIIYGLSFNDLPMVESDMAPCLVKPGSALFNNAVALSTSYAQLSSVIDPNAKPGLPENNFPSLIAYMHFEPKAYQVDRSRLGQPPAECAADDSKIVDAYASFWNLIQQFPSAGIIGVAPYASDPLFNGPFTSQGDSSIMLDKARKDAWYGGCQAQTFYGADYITQDRQNQKIAGLTNVYSSSPGASCDLSQDMSSLFNRKPANGKFGTSQIQEAAPPAGAPVSCDACLTDNSGIIPFGLDEGHLPVPPAGFCGTGGDLASVYAAFDSYSSDHELDPLLTRAITWRESVGAGEQVIYPDGSSERVFSPEFACRYSVVADAIGCNYLGIDNNPGNVPNTRGAQEHAPQLIGQPKPELLFSDAKTHNQVCQDNPKPQAGANQKFCAYGFMQVIDYPQYILEQQDPQWATRQDQATKNIISCLGDDLYFDPFDPDDNICLGTLKFKMAMDAQAENAKDIVDAYFNATGTDSNSDNYKSVYDAHINFMKAYLADIGYSGSEYRAIPGGARNRIASKENIRNDLVPKIKEMIEWCAPIGQDDFPQDCEGQYKPSQAQIDRCEAVDLDNFLVSIDRCFIDPTPNDNKVSGRIELLRRYAGLMKDETCKANVACPPSITSLLTAECVANAHNYEGCGNNGQDCFKTIELPDGSPLKVCNFDKYADAKVKAAIKARQGVQ